MGRQQPRPATTEEIRAIAGEQRAALIEEAELLGPGVLVVRSYAPDLDRQVAALRVVMELPATRSEPAQEDDGREAA